MAPEQLVQRFYHDVWNQANEAAAHEILAQNFRFRGSLGPEKRGAAGFIEYMHSIHQALANYRCTIKDMISTDERVAAQMLFEGIHQADFFGVPATGKEISWAGAAFFTVKDRKLSALWVLGDVDSVKAQLGSGAGSSFALQ